MFRDVTDIALSVKTIQWFLSYVFNVPPELVNPKDRPGRRSRSQRAPLQTGAKNSSGDLIRGCVQCFIVYIVPSKKKKKKLLSK